MLSVKIWNRFTHEVVGGGSITLEVKRLRYEEAAPLIMALATAYQARGDIKPDATRQEQVKATRAFLEAIPPAVVADAFKRFVRKVEGLESEEGPIETGEQLFEVADSDCVLAVLTELQRLARLGAKEADFFDLPSTSSGTPAAAPSSSDATPIDAADGPPSTATPIPSEPEPSIAGA